MMDDFISLAELAKSLKDAQDKLVSLEKYSLSTDTIIANKYRDVEILLSKTLTAYEGFIQSVPLKKCNIG